MASRRGMRVLLWVALVGLVGAAGLVGVVRRTPTLAPDFAVTDLKGQAVRLSSYRGKIVLLNLWATWCAPCRQEMPSMQELHRRLEKRDFQLLAVSEDEDGRRSVEPFVRELGLTFPVLLDPEQQVGDRYGVTGYPETFLIDRDGRVIERVIGPRNWTSPEWIARVEGLIAAPAGGDAPERAGGPTPPGPS